MTTLGQKHRRFVMERLLRAWDYVPGLTLGRLISNVEFIEGKHLRRIEDEELVLAAELFASTEAVRPKR